MNLTFGICNAYPVALGVIRIACAMSHCIDTSSELRGKVVEHGGSASQRIEACADESEPVVGSRPAAPERVNRGGGARSILVDIRRDDSQRIPVRDLPRLPLPGPPCYGFHGSFPRMVLR